MVFHHFTGITQKIANIYFKNNGQKTYRLFFLTLLQGLHIKSLRIKQLI